MSDVIPISQDFLGWVNQVVSGEGGSGTPRAKSEGGCKVDRLEWLIAFRNSWAADQRNQKALKKVVTF